MQAIGAFPALEVNLRQGNTFWFSRSNDLTPLCTAYFESLTQRMIARQEARLKMEKEKSVLMTTTSNQNNQGGALEIKVSGEKYRKFWFLKLYANEDSGVLVSGIKFDLAWHKVMSIELSILEFLAAKVLELTGNDNKDLVKCVTPRYPQFVIRNDEELNNVINCTIVVFISSQMY
ncbi:hypothetical protein GUJ93_ZPchr0014g46531 [Zizania palustris]|uniref:Uncharacterized protein n=1 Tax=Zizania palustris TaxID=103762 RepID=A0A8J5SWE4_ZIZPA|nr:hypothetical protein GUJ93_ZPchr0014g46531 [Zizania palustris]